MHILKKLTSFTLVCSAIVIGCAATSEEDGSGPLGALSQALPKIDAGYPPDPCRRQCTGKACGADDGCGGRCANGSCPAGTVCGGGGIPYVCECKPRCTGKECGASDECGGICTAGSCPSGQACGATGAPGVCAPIPGRQGVECFIFGDNYKSMEGPSDAIYFNKEGLACIPDGTASGECRKWFGRCRTTDPSHTPVEFAVGSTSSWYAWADAVYSRHYKADIFSPTFSEMCIPNGTSAGLCGTRFGGARTITGQPVYCRAFDDGYASATKLGDRMYDWVPEKVSIDTTWIGERRKWFGRCEVGACGDGFCGDGEDFSTCPKDCRCGDGLCNGGESASNCPKDCWCGNGNCEPSETLTGCAADCFCGNGVCDIGESKTSCPKDCGGTWCGDGACNGGETCSTCAGDCGECMVTTCSGQKANEDVAIRTVFYEDIFGCAGSVNLIANSNGEAAECVKAAGGKVIESPTIVTRIFHTDPTWGCSELLVPSFSDKSAASCAAAQGYTFEGPCPAPVVPDAGAGK